MNKLTPIEHFYTFETSHMQRYPLHDVDTTPTGWIEDKEIFLTSVAAVCQVKIRDTSQSTH